MVSTSKINFNKIINSGLSKSLSLDEVMHLAYLNGLFPGLHLDIRVSISSTLQEKGFVTSFEEEGKKKVRISQKGKNIFNLPAYDNSTLAKNLRDMYPAGLKDDKWPWRSTNVMIKDRLDKFRGIYPEATDEDIISATKKYLEKMHEDDRGRSILFNFIIKNTPEGQRSILAEYIEMGDEVKPTNGQSGNTMQI